jgi:hypothetical protein
MHTVGLSLGVATGAGMGTGLLVGGIVATKGAERDVRWPLWIGAAAVLLALPAALGSLFVSSAPSAIALVFLTLFLLLGVAAPPILAAAYSVVTPNVRTTAGAISIFFQSVLGFGLGPFCVGALSDALAPVWGAQSLRYALLAPICLIPAIAFVLHVVAKALPTDLRAVGIIDDDVRSPPMGTTTLQAAPRRQ